MRDYSPIEICRELILAEQEIKSARDRFVKITAIMIAGTHPAYQDIRNRMMFLYANDSDDLQNKKLFGEGTFFQMDKLIVKVLNAKG